MQCVNTADLSQIKDFLSPPCEALPAETDDV